VNTVVPNVLMHEAAKARNSRGAHSFKIVLLFCILRRGPIRLSLYFVAGLRRKWWSFLTAFV
jgi:hypothetical protein